MKRIATFILLAALSVPAFAVSPSYIPPPQPPKWVVFLTWYFSVFCPPGLTMDVAYDLWEAEGEPAG